MNVMLNARNSSKVRGRQPFSVHLSTAGSFKLRQNNIYIMKQLTESDDKKHLVQPTATSDAAVTEPMFPVWEK